MPKSTLLFIIIPVILSACSVFSPIKTEQTTEYTLVAEPVTLPKKTTHKINVVVAEPIAKAIYNTTQMAYSTRPFQISYFAKNRWAESPTQMLQPLLIGALQKTHYFSAVFPSSFVGYYDVVLNTQIISLKQVFYNDRCELHFALQAQITRANNQVVAAKEFSVIEAPPQCTPYGGVIAANRAVSRVLSELTRWCVGQRF